MPFAPRSPRLTWARPVWWITGILLLALRLDAPALAAGGIFPGSAPAGALEADRAFVLSGRGIDPRTVELRFEIAKGYYLYRDKLNFSVAAGAIAGDPGLPSGERKKDPFFGDVEIYRELVTVRVPLAQVRPGQEILLSAEFQGCADVGVCYPVARQSLRIALPRDGASPGRFVYAVPPRKSWFN